MTRRVCDQLGAVLPGGSYVVEVDYSGDTTYAGSTLDEAIDPGG